jgi:hypothetical protein
MRLLGLVRCNGTAASVAFPRRPRRPYNVVCRILQVFIGHSGRVGRVLYDNAPSVCLSSPHNTIQHSTTKQPAWRGKPKRGEHHQLLSCLSVRACFRVRVPSRQGPLAQAHAYKQLHTNTIALHRHRHTRYRIQETNRIAVSAYVRAWGRHQDNLEDGKLLQII